MKSFRSKPVGWQHDNYRHYLAAKYGSAGGLAAKYGSAGVRYNLKKNDFLKQMTDGIKKDDMYTKEYIFEERGWEGVPKRYIDVLFSKENEKARLKALGEDRAENIDEYIRVLQGAPHDDSDFRTVGMAELSDKGYANMEVAAQIPETKGEFEEWKQHRANRNDWNKEDEEYLNDLKKKNVFMVRKVYKE